MAVRARGFNDEPRYLPAEMMICDSGGRAGYRFQDVISDTMRRTPIPVEVPNNAYWPRQIKCLCACRVIPVCEPGVLMRTPSTEVTMGLAVVELAECYAMQGQPCDYCILRCPLKTQAIKPGKRGAPVIIQGGCVASVPAKRPGKLSS